MKLPPIDVTADDLWSLFGVLFSSFRFREDITERKQHGQVVLDKFGGRDGFSQYYKAYNNYLRKKGLPLSA